MDLALDLVGGPMKIVVTHLTRMQRGTVCVAGLDVETGHHVRPIQPMGVLQSRMTAPRGGPFDMATVVDLGTIRPVPTPPEVEDVEITWWHARTLDYVEPVLFWELLQFVAHPTLRELFGPALRTLGRSGRQRAVTDLRTGTASLGVLKPLGRPRLKLDKKPDGRDVVRMELWDGERRLNLSVTDLRLYADDGARPDRERVAEIAKRIDRGVRVLLGVGLTRPFAARSTETPVHWLQVNNVHLEDDPAWRLSPEVPFGPGLGEWAPVAATAGALSSAEEALPF
jgi:hypothetical protein